jgi:hypothetical protein
MMLLELEIEVNPKTLNLYQSLEFVMFLQT